MPVHETAAYAPQSAYRGSNLGRRFPWREGTVSKQIFSGITHALVGVGDSQTPYPRPEHIPQPLGVVSGTQDSSRTELVHPSPTIAWMIEGMPRIQRSSSSRSSRNPR